MLRNNYTTIQADAVVIGTGILGMMLAKRLVDLGQRVVIVEKSTRIADGASIMNHGWIHQGSGSAVSANSLDHARSIVKKMQYGFDFFKSYAPELFDEPFKKTYAFTADTQRAAQARKAWEYAGIEYKELTRHEFDQLGTGLHPDKASYFFEVPEARINNRLLFLKLFSEIQHKGAMVLMGAKYDYESDNLVRITSTKGEHRVSSPLFFYATGTSLDESYQKLTGEKLGLNFCKSHLLYLPKMTSSSLMGLDPGTPIIFNHGETSVVNRSYDEVVAESNTDLELDAQEVERSLEVLYDFYPNARQLRPETLTAKAFLKPFATEMGSGRHSAEQSIYEPKPGHIFALPGKMTAAPYVSHLILQQASHLIDASPISQRPFDSDARVNLPASPSRTKTRRPVVALNRLRQVVFAEKIEER